MNTVSLTITMTSEKRQESASESTKRTMRSVVSGLSAPWLMMAAVGLGVVGGLAIDRRFDSAPWGILGCSLFSLAAGIYLVIREGSR